MLKLCLLLLVLPAAALADDWQALERPGVMAIMRHALAPGTGDPAGFTPGDCSTQRNLDDRGRSQARALGAAFRDRGIAFDRVLASEWCRATETAALLDLGPVEPAPALNSFFAERRDNAPAQTAALRDIVTGAEGRLMMVTHQVNIRALTGRSTRSGEVLLIREGEGGIEVVGSLLIGP
ncbi:histidine phosphatase family protein [Oceaniglobus roseus]|uniref:histidine phosphatase family protein n=1 Tax=Oceaniglobus roseus TaxID=1737570 RepID=UPI001FE9A757|nr:histidine phosphatase family protein [Kandeliimicrobium roseum]